MITMNVEHWREWWGWAVYRNGRMVKSGWESSKDNAYTAGRNVVRSLTGGFPTHP